MKNKIKQGREGYIYQTVVTSNLDKEYKNATVMNTYDNLTDARNGYDKDMKEWKDNNPDGLYQYCIKEIEDIKK